MKKLLVMIQKSIQWVREHSLFQKFVVSILVLNSNLVFGQYMKAPTHYDAQTAAGHIIKGHIKIYLNDSLTKVVVEKKGDRWVTTYLNSNAVIKKINSIIEQGEPRFTGRTNGGYRFYINIYDITDDTKIINSLDITIDAFTQKIKFIEIKL